MISRMRRWRDGPLQPKTFRHSYGLTAWISQSPCRFKKTHSVDQGFVAGARIDLPPSSCQAQKRLTNSSSVRFRKAAAVLSSSGANQPGSLWQHSRHFGHEQPDDIHTSANVLTKSRAYLLAWPLSKAFGAGAKIGRPILKSVLPPGICAGMLPIPDRYGEFRNTTKVYQRRRPRI